MTQREDVARAMAFFEQSDDIALLHGLLEEIAPKAKRMVGQFLARGSEDTIPRPADLRAAREPASKDEAIRILRQARDFALFQVLARSIGQRIEAIEIVASAEFPEGARVVVPAKPKFPPTGPLSAGTVETTGTMLTVRLDNGETWKGPPTLAKQEGRP